METFEVSITVYEPVPHSLTVYREAEHVMSAVTMVMTDINEEYEGSFKASKIVAKPIKKQTISYANENSSEEVLALT